MKIILINASPRKTGATAKILHEFKSRLEGYEDTDVVLYHLSDLKIDYCKGCCICYKTGECIINDDAEMLSKEISEANGLIIGSPNYASAVSGQLKTFVDRGHFAVEQLLSNVYTISIVTYENADGRPAIKYMQKLFTVSGARNMGALLIKIPFNENPMDKERIKKQIGRLSNRLYNAIKTKASTTIVNRVFHAAALRFVFRPLVIKKGSKYQGVLKHWQKRGIRYE